MAKKLPSPVEHPNTFAGISVGAISAFLVIEAKKHFGIDVDIQEATFFVTAVIAVYLFFGKKFSKKT